MSNENRRNEAPAPATKSMVSFARPVAPVADPLGWPAALKKEAVQARHNIFKVAEAAISAGRNLDVNPDMAQRFAAEGLKPGAPTVTHAARAG